MRCLTTMLASVAAGVLLYSVAASAEVPSTLGVPQSVRLQHEQIVARLQSIAKRGGAPAKIAAEAAAVLKAHYAKEEEFVLPALGLLPTLLKNSNPADLERAAAMAERTRAASENLLKDHIQITALMTKLVEAGGQNSDEELVRIGTRVAAQSLNDIEVLHPTTILIGEYIRSKTKSGKE